MADQMTDTPVLDLVARMTADSLEASNLDAKSLMMVRIAALVAVGAPPVSYLANVGAAADSGIVLEDVQNILIAVAPIVGTARVAAAAGNITRALGFVIAAVEAELEAELEEEEEEQG